MQSVICLILLVGAGVAFSILSPTWFGFGDTRMGGVLGYWVTSIKWVAIPVVLLILRFTRGTLVKVMCFLWALWVAILSLLLLFRISILVPNITLYGVVLVGAVLVGSLGLSLFSTIELSRKKKRR